VQLSAARLGLKSGVDVRLRDLRPTVRPLLTKYCKVDRFILKRILNHVDDDVTAIYDRNRFDEPNAWSSTLGGRRLLHRHRRRDHRVDRSEIGKRS
jgi:hypothetical protein